MLLLLAQLVVGLLVVAFAVAYAALIVFSPAAPVSAPSELTYRTSTTSPHLPLPLLTSPATVELTAVVPAYNEKDRLGLMLREAVEYLETCTLTSEEERRLPEGVEHGSYEVLIVDDGSKDGTTDVALRLAEELEKGWTQDGRKTRGNVKVVTLAKNRGKGGAVKHGVLHSAGHRILFVDADGASHFPDVALLHAELDRLELSQSIIVDEDDNIWKGGHGLVVGSRAHLVRTEAVVKRSFLRNLLMRLFHTYLYVLGIRAIRDTQCGFKLSSRPTSLHIYPLLHSPAWIFDCELLLLASLASIPTREIGIKWHEVEGSKIDLVVDSIKMARDLLVVRGNYWLGRWKAPQWLGVERSEEEKEHEGWRDRRKRPKAD